MRSSHVKLSAIQSIYVDLSNDRSMLNPVPAVLMIYEETNTELGWLFSATTNGVTRPLCIKSQGAETWLFRTLYLRMLCIVLITMTS